jgi:hypothetical protein
MTLEEFEEIIKSAMQQRWLWMDYIRDQKIGGTFIPKHVLLTCNANGHWQADVFKDSQAIDDILEVLEHKNYWEARASCFGGSLEGVGEAIKKSLAWSKKWIAEDN